MTLHLSAPHDAALRAHAQAAYPNECCGFLFGRSGPDGAQVESLLPADNQRTDAAHHRYLITPEAYLEAELLAARQGVEILGFYHSHPDAPARPSEFDRTHALPGCSYVIVSVRERVAQELTSWVLTMDYDRFVEEPVRVAPASVAEGEDHASRR